MQPTIIRWFCALALTASLPILGQTTPQTNGPPVGFPNSPLPSPSIPRIPPAVAEPTPIDLSSTRWQAGGSTNSAGSVIEVATGLNYSDENGVLQRSQDLIQLTLDGGAAAMHGIHKVFFPPALTGAVSIVTVSNRVFRTRPIGLVLHDESSGKSLTLVTLQESVSGLLSSPNTVDYPSAMSNAVVNAGLRFSYTHNGFQCDIVFSSQLNVTPEAVGMNPAFTRIQFWHSFDGPSLPQKTQNVLVTETNAALRATMLEPDLLDSTLDFGDLWLPLGRAALLEPSTAPDPNTPVEIRVANPQGDTNQAWCGKEFLVTTNGSFIVESMNWSDVAPKLAALPPMASTAPVVNLREQVVQGRTPPVPVAGPRLSEPIRLATHSRNKKEFAWAYTVVPSSGTSYTFGSGTYFLSSGGYFGGTVTFSAGSVLKYAPNQYLLLYGSVVCNGTTGNPTLMTSRDEDIFGEIVFGSTGYPNKAASQAIWLYYEGSNITLSNLRIRWAQTAVQVDQSGGSGLTHQFNNSAIELAATGVAADNCTISISGSTYCSVPTPTSNLGSATFSGSLSDACSGNIGGIPDAWFMQYFGSLTAYGTNDDPNGDWNSIAYDYQHGLNPSQTMVAVWGSDLASATNVPSGLGDAKAIAGGWNYGLALEANGSVKCWGDAGSAYPVIYFPGGLTNTMAIAAGFQWAGVVTNGRVVTWGVTNGATQPVITNAMALAIGYLHAVALCSNGTVQIWGWNGVDANGDIPPFPAITNATAIAAGYEHTLALLGDGTVQAWGAGTNGDHSIYNRGQSIVPASLTNSSTANVVAIAAGAYHSMALRSDGSVIAWGAGTNGDNSNVGFNQSIVPAGLSSVVAIAADGYHSMALKSDGTVVIWGDMSGTPSPLLGIRGIGCSTADCLAIRPGPLTPFMIQPILAAAPAVIGSSLTLSVIGTGLAGVVYQWQFNASNISGATNGSYTIGTLNGTTEGNYTVIVSTGAGSVTNTAVVVPNTPSVTSQTPVTSLWVTNGGTLTFGVQATDNLPSAWPLSYRWKFAGTNLSSGSSSNYTLVNAKATDDGSYTLIVTNSFGTNTVILGVHVMSSGSVAAWGRDDSLQLERSGIATNIMQSSGGGYHSVAVTDSGAVLAWGDNSYTQTNIPSGLTNAVAVSGGGFHSLALLSNGSVVAWGANWEGQTNVPPGLTSVAAVAAGGWHSMALLSNGTVTAWGYSNEGETNIPAGLSSVSAIAAGAYHSMALLSNGTVVAWGYNGYGETSVPSGLTNVVAIAAGGYHSMALQSNGKVTAWGYNYDGETNVPANLTNAMAIAAGFYFSAALKNDGTVVTWGENSFGECSPITNQPSAKRIAAGWYHALADLYSPWVQYPIDVTKDLLLIYNTNSASAIGTWVKDYYLAKRPGVSQALTLGINTATNEAITALYFTTNIAPQIQTWLTANPTKRPQFVILFPDVPSAPIGDGTTEASVQVQLATGWSNSWIPFVTSINMNTTNDCAAYIDKIAAMGTNNNNLGRLVISAGGGSYANTNYYFDDANYLFTIGLSGWAGLSGVLQNGGQLASISYVTNTDNGLYSHLTNGTHVAGYFSWGFHSSLGSSYAINSTVNWNANSGWWIIQTGESLNGLRGATSEGRFIDWFQSNAFGGTSYSHTPIGAISNAQEPSSGGLGDSAAYFGSWQAGKRFATCAWISRQIAYPGAYCELQAVGDPFVTK